MRKYPLYHGLSQQLLKHLKWARHALTLKGLEHRPIAPVRSLTLVQQDGTICEILALEQRKLDLNIQRVPREVEEKWKDRGICISDLCASGISHVHILIGADYVNNFLLEKKVVD